MKVKLEYGDGQVNVEVPEGSDIFETVQFYILLI